MNEKIASNSTKVFDNWSARFRGDEPIDIEIPYVAEQSPPLHKIYRTLMLPRQTDGEINFNAEWVKIANRLDKLSKKNWLRKSSLYYSHGINFNSYFLNAVNDIFTERINVDFEDYPLIRSEILDQLGDQARAVCGIIAARTYILKFRHWTDRWLKLGIIVVIIYGHILVFGKDAKLLKIYKDAEGRWSNVKDIWDNSKHYTSQYKKYLAELEVELALLNQDQTIEDKP